MKTFLWFCIICYCLCWIGSSFFWRKKLWQNYCCHVEITSILK